VSTHSKHSSGYLYASAVSSPRKEPLEPTGKEVNRVTLVLVAKGKVPAFAGCRCSVI